MTARRGTASAILAVITVVAACAPTGGVAAEGPSGGAVRLEVYAAASLREVLRTAVDTWEAEQPGVTVSISTDSSAALATKIEQGAPADVFLSADTANPARLAEAGLAASEVVAFAANHLVVIVPADNPAGIDEVADLGGAGVAVVAAADGVPIQQYTAELLERLADDAGVGAAFPAAYEANVVSREDNVSAIVAKVALGEADAGIVYATDAAASDAVAAIPIPAAANPTATYGGIVVEGSSHPAEAAAFLGWLAGPEGQAILHEAGFLPVR